MEPSPDAPSTGTNSARPSGARSRWVGALLVLGAVVAGVVAWRARDSERGPGRARRGEAGPPAVRTVHPSTRDLPIHLEGIGTVTALQTAVVRPQVAGPLVRMPFREGELVREGDVLAELDPRPFRVELAQAEAVLSRERAALAAARAVLDRDRRLQARELLAIQDLEAQQASVDALEATERAARAAVDRARLEVGYAQVRAPFDGRVGLRRVDPGNVVSPSDADGLVVITQVEPIAVVFSLPQDDLAAVRARMAVEALPVEVFASGREAPLAVGRLTVIDNRIDPATGTVRVRAEVDDAAGALWPNQLVEVRVLLETRAGVMVLPDATVQHGPEGPFVYVVVDGHAQVRPVQIERTVDDLAILSSGVTVTDDVISEGQSRVRPGGEVQREGDAGPEPGRSSPVDGARGTRR